MLKLKPNASTGFVPCLPCCFSIWKKTGATAVISAVKHPSYGNGIENFFQHHIHFPPSNYGRLAGHTGEIGVVYRQHSEQHGTVGRGFIGFTIPRNGDYTNGYLTATSRRVGFMSVKFQQVTEDSRVKFYYSVDSEDLDSENKSWTETPYERNGDFAAIEITTVLLQDIQNEPVTVKIQFLLPDYSLGLQMPGRQNSTLQFASMFATVKDSAKCFENTYACIPFGETFTPLAPVSCDRTYPNYGVGVLKHSFEIYGYYILFPMVYGVLQNTGYRNAENELVFETFLNIDFRENVFQFFDGNVFYFHCKASSLDVTYDETIFNYRLRSRGTGSITITT